MKRIKSATLIELISAVIIGMLIVFGIYSFSAGVKGFHAGTDRSAQVVKEAAFIIDHISKTVGAATGDITNRGIRMAGNNLAVRRDINNTPDTYTDDRWAGYRYNNNNNFSFFLIEK